MGFSGGGSNILKPHTHDSNILQDGGNLDFKNITQSDMSASSMTYSDGSHLQELAIGSTGEHLGIVAGVPAWTASGKLILLETWTASGDATTKTFTDNRNLKDDYQELVIFVNGQVGTSAQDLTLAINADTTGYDSNTIQAVGATLSSANVTSASNWVIGSSSLLDVSTRMYESEIHITWNPSAQEFQMSSRLYSVGKGQNIIGGYVAGGQADGICTDLVFAVSAGKMINGLQINIYAVER